MKKAIVFAFTFALVIGAFLLTAVNTRGRPSDFTSESSEQAFNGLAAGAPAAMPMKLFQPSAPPALSPAKSLSKRREAFDSKGSDFGGSMGTAGGGAAAMADRASDMAKAMPVIASEQEEASRGEGGAEAASRAWFPETFVFEPLVVTDAQGRANVPVKVPDRLTTWRVLALAHSRQGAQAGTVASFLGTLPTYVDAVTPPFLTAGDEVRLPVQLVNTTDAEVSSSLRFDATGATLSATGGVIRIPASGNALQYVTLSTKKPGVVSVKATLGGTDAVERTIVVVPAGKRELVSRGGSLAAPRTFELEGPFNALPGSEQVQLRVFPGALGLVRSELSAAPGRGGVAEDAYLLQLLGRAPALLRSLGSEPDMDTIRDLTLLATQRTMQHARDPSVDAATLLAESALQHPESPVLARVGERLLAQVASAQRPDGTCQGGNGWKLQRLLVTTADCVRAVQAGAANGPQQNQRAAATRIKAAGAFERNAARIVDGYTAAAVLASGAVTGTVADSLRAVVLAAIKEGVDGAKYLEVPSGIERADGVAPSRVEATALAVLALMGDDTAPLADLGTYLLSGYNPIYGWGDGRANLVCLRAVAALFKDKVPAGVALTLERDGKVLGEGSIDASKLQEVISMNADATGSSGKHTWSVKANPPVAGLGYSLTLVAYVPWRETPGTGLSLTTKLPEGLMVGRSADVALTASLPGGLSSRLKLALPAGVQPDSDWLKNLVSAGTITRYETEDGAVTLHVPALANGAVFNTTVRVTPTLAGRLQSAASELAPESRPLAARAFAPNLWVIK